ncbi:MAG: GlyGly-CTERM sorting domain-containing protein [Gammaproteobacteria bacterium]|nr:GlyGly-CTERM sorting domain-containing protein [Gammaproteobacteria bacterium]
MNRKPAIWTFLACIGLSGNAVAGEVTTVYVGATNGGVTLDSVGDIYAANYGDINAVTGSEFVWKISPTGAFNPIIFATDINIASGNDFDSQDNLYQSNFGGDSISRIDPSGIVTSLPGVIDGPVGIAIDDSDNLFVNSCLENRIVQVDINGAISTFVNSAQLDCPNGITRAPSGDFYAINWRDGRIFRITAAGAISGFATITPQGGHVTIAGDRLYATSFGANQIYGFELTGANAGNLVVTIGTGAAGSADGSYSVASFNGPNGITTDATGGVLYVTDQTGVRKIELEDEVAPPPPPPPPTPAPSGGGGGSVSWAAAFMLLAMCLTRRRGKLLR